MSLFNELKRRNVIRVAIAYLAAAWLLIEVSDTIFPYFDLGESAVRLLIVLLAIAFPLFLIFSWVFEMTPEGLVLEKDVKRKKSITSKTGKTLDRIIIVLLALALGYFAFDKFVLDPVEDARIAESAHDEGWAEAVTGSVGDKSIAVLPFVNISGDPDEEYFSDGISEELLNLLGKIPEIRVPARTSSFFFKGGDSSITEIAQKLNVAHILEGSVRLAGEQVRVTAKLIEARSDTLLWSESYDRTLDDIFAIQDDIAAAVVSSLKLTMLGGLPKAQQIDSEAYALFLRARHRVSAGDAEDLIKANGMLKHVLELAPEYAPAWRTLAHNYGRQANIGLRSRDDGYALSNDALHRALEIDPDYAAAHSAVGWNFMAYDFDFPTAAKHFKRALSLEPNNPTVLVHSAVFLAYFGHLDESIAIHEYLALRDPLNVTKIFNVGWLNLRAGRPDEALRALGVSLTLAPNRHYINAGLAWAFLLKGNYEAALEAAEKETLEAARLFGLVTIYHAMGQLEHSDEALVELIERYGEIRPFYVADALAYRGENDRAFEWLDRSVKLKSGGIESIVVDSWLKGLHDDSRWIPFLESIGMSPAQLAAIEFDVVLPE